MTWDVLQNCTLVCIIHQEICRGNLLFFEKIHNWYIWVYILGMLWKLYIMEIYIYIYISWIYGSKCSMIYIFPIHIWETCQIFTPYIYNYIYIYTTGWWFQTWLDYFPFHIVGMSSETHWRTPSFFKMVKSPATRLIICPMNYPHIPMTHG